MDAYPHIFLPSSSALSHSFFFLCTVQPSLVKLVILFSLSIRSLPLQHIFSLLSIHLLLRPNVMFNATFLLFFHILHLHQSTLLIFIPLPISHFSSSFSFLLSLSSVGLPFLIFFFILKLQAEPSLFSFLFSHTPSFLSLSVLPHPFSSLPPHPLPFHPSLPYVLSPESLIIPFSILFPSFPTLASLPASVVHCFKSLSAWTLSPLRQEGGDSLSCLYHDQ